MTDHADALLRILRALVREELREVVVERRPPRLLSIQETAERLGVARSHLYRHINSGSLRTVRVGGRRLVSEAAIADFIAGREREGDRAGP